MSRVLARPGEGSGIQGAQPPVRQGAASLSPRSHTTSQTHNSTFSQRSERECLRGEEVSHLPKRVPRAEATLVCDRGGHVTGEEQGLLSREPVSGFTEAGRSAETSLCARLLSTASSSTGSREPQTRGDAGSHGESR